MRNIKPSMHFLENFMPIMEHEEFAVNLLKQASEIPFYEAVELGHIEDKKCRKDIKELTEQRNWQLTQWLSPKIMNANLSLSNLNEDNRRKSVDLAKKLIDDAAETGCKRAGLQSGPDPGDELREDAKKVLMESCLEISEYTKQYKDLYLIIEPLDRYAHKKQLLGPIDETVKWFSKLKENADNFYIHWDSAHEKLGGVDLIASLKLSAPYLAQFHICNCVDDPTHPYYGDQHMEVGRAPNYESWGYLTPSVAAEMLKTAANLPDCEGINTTYCALEVRAHLGDNLWEKEKLIRNFLMDSFDLAGIEYKK